MHTKDLSSISQIMYSVHKVENADILAILIFFLKENYQKIKKAKISAYI